MAWSASAELGVRRLAVLVVLGLADAGEWPPCRAGTLFHAAVTPRRRAGPPR
jgi:hypothetical protein